MTLHEFSLHGKRGGNVVARYAAAGAYCLCRAYRDGERRLTELLGESPCHETDDAGGPVIALNPEQHLVLLIPPPPVVAQRS